ncbi:OsmC family protein [Terriglobus sp. 2YAB30_2]|uniref:OsmC family protein n=1 Tax=unclassified Terriglobus TaxID=2628988 RepID=UPI003F957525
MSETLVHYQGGLRCRAEHAESGTVVITDAPKDNHGKGESFSPSEMLAVSLGSCILSIMAIAAQSMDIDITGATATVEKEMANAPRRFSKLAVTVHVPYALSEEQARRLERAAHACPVHNILKPEIDATITFRWG